MTRIPNVIKVMRQSTPKMIAFAVFVASYLIPMNIGVIMM
jgi:uncharacterized paraquat-inducible protein A